MPPRAKTTKKTAAALPAAAEETRNAVAVEQPSMAPDIVDDEHDHTLDEHDAKGLMSIKPDAIADALLRISEGFKDLSLAISGKQDKAVKEKRVRKAVMVQMAEDLAELLGRDADEIISKTDVNSALMAYVRTHELQDASDRRKIIVDAPLAQLIGSDEPVTVLTILSALKHKMTPV